MESRFGGDKRFKLDSRFADDIRVRKKDEKPREGRVLKNTIYNMEYRYASRCIYFKVLLKHT